MVSSPIPIARILSNAHKFYELISDLILRKDMEHISAIIKDRFVNRPVIDIVDHDLLPDYFEMRNRLVTWVLKKGYDLSITQYSVNSLIKEWDEMGNSDSPNNFLASQLAKIMKLSVQMNGGLLDVAGEMDLNELITSIQSEDFTYQSLEVINKLPLQRLKYFKQYVDESIRFDIGTSIADMILENVIHADAEKVNEVISYMWESFERMGAWMIFMELWDPGYGEDNPQIYSNMRILSSVYEAECGMGTEMTLKDFEASMITE